MIQRVRLFGRASLCLVAVWVGFVSVSDVRGQEKPPTSLSIAPRDSSFYVATMNHRAVWTAVAESRAFQELWNSPVGQRMRKAWRGRGGGFEQFGRNPFAEYLRTYAHAFDNPIAKMILPFAREAAENEFFAYADDSLPSFLDAMNKVQIESAKTSSPADREEFLRSIAKHLDETKIPTVVIGCVLSDPANFTDLMRLSKTGLEQTFKTAPPDMAAFIKSFKVLEGENRYLLTMTIQGSELPWEQLTGDPDFRDMAPELVEAAAEHSLAVAVGVQDQFLIVSIGPSLDHIDNWGAGEKLIDLPRLAPLKNALAKGKRLTSAHYSSADYARRSFDLKPLVGIVRAGFEAGLAQSGDEELKDELLADLEREASVLLADIDALMPKWDESFGYSYLHSDGIEGFSYNYSETRFVDGSKPLALFRHMGNRPAIAIATRGKGSPEQFAFLKKWSDKTFEYAIKYIPKFAPSDAEAKHALSVISAIEPFWNRFRDILESKLIPATEGGESGFVIDFVEADRRWHASLPLSSRKLPVPSLALVLEVADREKIKEAGRELLALGNDVLDWASTLPDANIPKDFKFLPPEVKSGDQSDVFFYRIPEQVGLHASIVPHARLSDTWLVFAYLENRSNAIVQEQSFDPIVPIDFSRNAYTGIYLNANEIIDAVNAWVLYAVEQRDAQFGPDYFGPAEDETLNFSRVELLDSWDSLIEFAKCFRGASSLSYIESGATITHFQLRFADLAD